MSSCISQISKLDSTMNPVVLMNNFSTYLVHRQHNMKGFLAQDRSIPKVMSHGPANMVMVTIDELSYYGYIGNIGAESMQPKSELMRTYIARRNRETGKMRLVEVQSCSLQHTCHHQPSKASTDEIGHGKLDEKKMQKMMQKYSSKTSKRLYNRMKNKTLDIRTMEDKLRRTIDDAQVMMIKATKTEPGVEAMDSNEGLAQDDVQSEMVSKINKNATSLHDLYRVEDLIKPDVLQKLKQPAKKLLQTPPEELLMVNDYLQNKVKECMQSPDKLTMSNIARVRVCLIMDVMGRLCSPTFRVGHKKESISPFTNELNNTIQLHFLQRVQDKFSTQLRSTQYTRNKATMYYLALMFVLEASDTVDIEVIHRSLGMTKSNIITYGRMIGARFNNGVFRKLAHMPIKQKKDDVEKQLASIVTFMRD
ncbi:uncharacterized protein LOC128728406 [Anopheles nili]|uniref:uncharacterized protein LOC128728406 n=1 Tax=Anopheles nili TaxID=185578 RepID=UPI00237BD7E5|nr:uncharacterized protein LOC128728406 [Anopheles nili]